MPIDRKRRDSSLRGWNNKNHLETLSDYVGTDLLLNKVALIAGGDRGIGRSVAVLYAEEGADIIITYSGESSDAQNTRLEIEKRGRKAFLIQSDVSNSTHCKIIVAQSIKIFGRIDILVNIAGVEFPQDCLTKISDEQLHKTFETNIYACFYMCREVLPYMGKDGVIINTTSVAAYPGNDRLIDCSATNGAILNFTKSLSASLAHIGIRVNGVAIKTIKKPLADGTLLEEELADFGQDDQVVLSREPSKIAPCFVYLASDLSNHLRGRFLHPNELVDSLLHDPSPPDKGKPRQ
jgi:NAD(P)-dependent dehydrogenase (short-subunit alcohol dehydrogenase family)